MSRKNVHIVPHGNRWEVRREGVKSPVSNHRSQHAAEEAGRRLARAGEGELVIHRPDGRIRDKDSYGNDPCPPRDTRH